MAVIELELYSSWNRTENRNNKTLYSDSVAVWPMPMKQRSFIVYVDFDNMQSEYMGHPNSFNKINLRVQFRRPGVNLVLDLPTMAL